VVSQFFSFKAVPEQVNDDEARIGKEVAVHIRLFPRNAQC